MEGDAPDLGADETGSRAALTGATLDVIARSFALGDVAEARDLGGTYNLNVLVRASCGIYVVRAYRPWVTPARLDAIQRTRLALAGQGLPVPRPLTNGLGAGMMAINGRLVEVDPFVAHDAVADTWERYAAAFEMLGRLHDALIACVPSPLTPPRVANYGTPAQMLRWMDRTEAALERQVGAERSGEGHVGADRAEEARATCRAARELLTTIGRRWDRAGPSLPLQPIHGDYGGGNVLLRDGRVVGVLDWDFLAVRERAYELAYSAYWLLNRLEPCVGPDSYPWDSVHELLSVYDGATERPLSAHERRALPWEMARVPLYWIAEAGFTPDPVEAILSMAPAIPLSRWLVEDAADLF